MRTVFFSLVGYSVLYISNVHQEYIEIYIIYIKHSKVFFNNFKK